MEDKRQRARVQGSWAGPIKKTQIRSASHCYDLKNQSVEPRLGPELVAPGTAPGWAPPDRSAAERQFVFEKPSEVKRKIPEPRLIEKDGVYDISTGLTGVARLQLSTKFIEPKEADWIFEQLMQEIPWKQKTNIRQGLSYEEPRLTAWYGELPYTYSKATMEPNPHWHPLLTMLKDRIEEVTGRSFDSLLCNLYRNGKDSIDWHSDNELSLGTNPVIASLSFGESRVFEMRKKPPPEEKGDYTYMETVRIPLDHGTLLLMEGSTQEDWQHRVPKEYHDKGARINLTFRTIYPEPHRGRSERRNK